MASAATVARLHPSLRVKVLLMAIGVVFIPLIVVWSIGTYEALMRRQISKALDATARELASEVARRGLAVSTVGEHQRWLEAFAGRHGLMIEVVDTSGKVLHQTPLAAADSWAVPGRPPRRRSLFFGPARPPDLLAHEAALPPLAERQEVVAALGGQTGATWRYTDDHRMWIFYRAVPIARGGGALYCVRVSRRNVRALYDFRYPLLQLTLVLACGVAGMAVWIGLRFVRPIGEMQRAIRAHLENPAEVAPEVILLPRADELGMLSRDVASLATSMQAQYRRAVGLAAELAHDLKNPIATVTASAELLAGQSAAPGDRPARLAAALELAAEHMNRSVDGLLRLARLDHELATQRRGPVDLSQLVSEVVAALRGDPRLGQRELQTELEPSVRVVGIGEQLETLLRNLLDNALLFARARVAVSLRQTGGKVALTVDDDGPGIPAGNLDKLFRRFFTARPEGLPSGTGLGLATARTIATAHQGELAAEAHGDLGGARFVLTLPAA